MRFKHTMLLAVLFMLSLSLFGRPLSALAQEAAVTYLEGEAFILRGSDKIPAALGSLCQTGDLLETGGHCTLDLTLNDLAGCRLLASSQAEITNTDASDMRVAIKSGNAVLNLKKLPKNSSFRVETPTAIAAVRGTQFWGRVETQNPANPVTTFAVREGIVEIFAKTSNQTFTLEKGQALDIPLDGSLPTVRVALNAELKAMEQADAIKTSA